MSNETKFDFKFYHWEKTFKDKPFLRQPFGENWETTFFTPSDPDVYAQWQLSNMGDLFGIAIDSEKNVYFTTTATAGGNFNVGSCKPYFYR